MNKNILITGGIGFIGSAISMKLLELGYNVTIIDFDVSPDSFSVAKKLEDIAIRNNVIFDWCQDDLCKITSKSRIGNTDFYDAVIHCAAYKSIAMSISQPIDFYRNNVVSTMNLINWCYVRNIKRILFSSTAAVYDPELWYCYEDNNLDYWDNRSGYFTINSEPYSGSKLMCEQLFLEYNKRCDAECVIFRYFNPIGSYKKLRTDISDSMFGNGFRAVENNETFHIFGGDYETKDGTCLRDYVDLRDIVEAHVKVLESDFIKTNRPIYNLGTGRELSVLDCCKIIKSFIPSFTWDVIKRRPGDSVAGIANCKKIERDYGWKSSYTVEQTVQDFLS